MYSTIGGVLQLCCIIFSTFAWNVPTRGIMNCIIYGLFGGDLNNDFNVEWWCSRSGQDDAVWVSISEALHAIANVSIKYLYEVIFNL